MFSAGWFLRSALIILAAVVAVLIGIAAAEW
jgi:hypothetical protein